MRHMIAGSLIVLVGVSNIFSEEVVDEISWSQLAEAGRLVGGDIQEDGTLKIAHADSGSKTVPVLELKRPGVTALRYALTGKVRYDDVQGTSYLEMWNYFPNGGGFFSRTLAEGGPMASILGSSDWRPFCVPFFSDERAGPPDRLELNIVFGGSGTVCLSPLRLVQFVEGEDPLALAAASGAAANAWWGSQTAGLIGGIAGSMVGLAGALIGVLAGLGKARQLTIGLLWCSGILGGVAFAAGLAAAGLGQPYAVYYPMLLLGAICASGTFLLPVIRRRFEQIEMRRIAAMDVGGNSGSGELRLSS